MMLRQLNDLHESGEPVAALWASESAIYGRYGYGCASQVVNMKIKRGEAAYLPDAPHDPALRVRLAAPAAVRSHLAVLYAAQADRPGFIPRSDLWWDALLEDPEYARDGYGPLLVARHAVEPRAIREMTVAVPGTLTSAYLALKLFAPGVATRVVPFD